MSSLLLGKLQFQNRFPLLSFSYLLGGILHNLWMRKTNWGTYNFAQLAV